MIAAVESLRLLHERSEHGYTEIVGEGLHDEPEAVSETYQRFLVRQRERDVELQQREQWRESRDSIRDELRALRTVRYDPSVYRDLAKIERMVAGLDRRLA